MTVRVTIDTDVCIGTGNCVFNMPDVFEQDEDGVTRVRDQTLADQTLASVPVADIRFAAGSCPVGAIRVDDPD